MFIYYDVECFEYDSLVVMKDGNNSIIGIWWSIPQGQHPEDDPNGFEGIGEVIKGHTLVGYNNHHYDDLMLTAMMWHEPQERIKALNDKILAGDNVTVWRKRASDLVSIDTMQQIDVSMPSLKQIEGNLGRSIKESSVPFDIKRPLTDAEKQEVLQYCAYDVETTITIHKLREKSYFQVKDALVGMLPSRSKLKNPSKLNTTTLAADILLDRPLIKWSALRLPDSVLNTRGIPSSAWDMWQSQERLSSKEFEDKQVVVQDMGCDITFAFGGLHGAAVRGREFRDVKLLDVGSMYPSIIVNLNALGKGTEVYDRIRQERLKIKKSDPVRANALKLILNSVYGNLKNRYSILYNPLAALSVCVYGQVALFDLSRRLERAGYMPINLNTDGVAFIDKCNRSPDDWERVKAEWEQEYNLTLELDTFKRWIQKDVNNYVAVTDTGHIKVKGGETNKYAEDKVFANNNARIIHIALVDYLLKDIPFYKTILNHRDDPKLFQYILKAGRTYRGVVDENGNSYNKVNRVFAVNDGVEHTKLYKQRVDGGLVNFPDMPDRMMVWNGEVSDLQGFRDVCDLEHYYRVTEKKLEGWR